MMPDIDGYSVLSVLRKSRDTAAIPLIFLTAKVTMADLRRGMEFGADDYLTKPCTVEQFLAAINTRLKRQEQLARIFTNRSPLKALRLGPEAFQKVMELPLEATDIFPDCSKLAQYFASLKQTFIALLIWAMWPRKPDILPLI
jgi:DNA-binding response OmpR family regulator